MAEVADWILRIVIWGFILGVSIASGVHMIRKRRIDSHSQVGLVPKGVRHWMLGEYKRPPRK